MIFERCIVSIHLLYIIYFFLDNNLHKFYFYTRKEGKFIICFGEKVVPTIWLIFLFLIKLKALYVSY